MDILSATIGILGLGVSITGVYYTRKTFKNTDTIKKSIDKEIHRDRLYAELPELLDKVNKCEAIALSPKNPFKANLELISEINYVCDRLIYLMSDDNKKFQQANELMLNLKSLRNFPDAHPDLQMDYCVLIKDIKSLLKSERS